MRRLLLAAGLLVSLSAVPTTLADAEFDALLDEYTAARKAWREQSNSPESTDAAATEASVPARDPIHEFLPRFEAYAKKHRGESAALPALAWIIENAPRYLRGSEGKDAAESAVGILTSDHAADPAIKEHLSSLRYAYYQVGKEPLIALYERIIAANQDKEAAAWATFNLAFTHYRGADDLDRALPLFRRTVQDFPDTPAATQAAAFVYEAEHLQIGMTAPEIVGTDVNGKEIRLSQFRGQVVVLDFWGFW